MRLSNILILALVMLSTVSQAMPPVGRSLWSKSSSSRDLATIYVLCSRERPNCGSSQYCQFNNGRCWNKLPLGNVCQSNEQCASGKCKKVHNSINNAPINDSGTFVLSDDASKKKKKQKKQLDPYTSSSNLKPVCT